MPIENYYDALTDARLSVWQAIDSHEDTRELFRRSFRFGSGSSVVNDMVPGIGDLDAIWIMPTRAIPKWVVSTRQRIAHTLAIVMWTRDWNIETAERNVLKISRAIHMAKPVGGVKFTAPYAPQVGPSPVFQNVKINDQNPIHCIKTTMELVLHVPFQPDA